MSLSAADTEKPIWLELALQEYNALRDEILTTMQTQDGTLRFGVAALGIVIASAFNIWDDDALAVALVLVAVVPFISTVVITVWMGEVTRMMRAGAYLQEFEDMVKNEITGLPEPVMKWETKLREEDQTSKFTRWKRHYEWNYLAIVLLFWSIGIAAIGAGIYRGLISDSELDPQKIWIGGVSVAAATMVALFLILRQLATVCDTKQRPLCWLKKPKNQTNGDSASAAGTPGPGG